jgi:hypothetical protein
MGKKLYIGYDLGDGETITDNALVDSNQNFNITQYTNMTMPGTSEPGKAIPTAYGYDNSGNVVFSNIIAADHEKAKDISMNFKRKPLDLINDISNKEMSAIVQLLDNEKREWPDSKIVNTPGLLDYKKKVIEFTNAIFDNKEYKERIRSMASIGNATEIVITVGHPTKWSRLDALIYKKILHGSILGEKTYAGYPVSLVLAQESRAAFLYERQINGLAIPKGTCVMLVDVGSSTIDITALTADSRNSQYNSGNNYLGARAIDWLIFEWYLKQLFEKNADYRNDYNDIILNNPTSEMSLLLNCRKAKEDVFSTKAVSKIIFADFPIIRLEPDKLNELIDKYPIANVLKKYVGIPENILDKIGDKSWKDSFYDFMAEEQKVLSNSGTEISQIIFTGSASRMPVVIQVTNAVFAKVSTAEDMDPARTISKGLVAVGSSNDKSIEFQKDISEIIKVKVPRIISDDLPVLVDGIGSIPGLGAAVADIIENIVVSEFSNWKKGKHKTINNATDAIKSNCTEARLASKLNNDSKYKNAITNWYKNKVGKDIAMELQELCRKYNVQDEFKLNDLNIVDVKIDGISINSDKLVDLNAVDVVGTMVSILAGIIAAIILPFVLGIVIGILSWISITIASILFSILAAIPGPGWVILAGIAGVSVFVLVRDGLDSAKETIKGKIVSWDLPGWVRERVSDEKVKSSLNREDISAKIKSALQEESSKKKITDQLMFTLNTQINVKADEIKYTIESM